jgi:hypothetical protein
VLSRTNKHPTGYIRPRNTKMTSAEPRLQVLKTLRRAAALRCGRILHIHIRICDRSAPDYSLGRP